MLFISMKLLAIQKRDLPSDVVDIIAGDFVLLGTSNEKAWVVVTSRTGSRFTGQPTYPGSLGGATSVRFTTKNIVDWTESGTTWSEPHGIVPATVGSGPWNSDSSPGISFREVIIGASVAFILYRIVARSS